MTIKALGHEFSEHDLMSGLNVAETLFGLNLLGSLIERDQETRRIPPLLLARAQQQQTLSGIARRNSGPDRGATMSTTQKAKGSAEVAASNRAGSTNPTKDQEMNTTRHTTASPGAASKVPHRPGADQRTDVLFAVANLGSLFTVCAAALDGTQGWSDEVKYRITQEVKLVLEWGALLSDDASILAEKLMGEVE